jgi:cupin fold WbuC family metalloprotein
MKDKLKVLDKTLIDGILELARGSQKKRAMYSFHEQGESLQRMLYAGLEATYVRPHKHQAPVKLEVYLIIQGKASLLVFDDAGQVKETIRLDPADQVHVAEIPAGIWHSLVIDSKEAVFYEIIEGPYDPFTFKAFPGWAPEEDDEAGGREYLQKLKQQLSPKRI